MSLLSFGVFVGDFHPPTLKSLTAGVARSDTAPLIVDGQFLGRPS